MRGISELVLKSFLRNFIPSTLKENNGGVSELIFETFLIYFLGGDVMALTEEGKRQEREQRRRIVGFWKSSAQAMRDGTGMLMREARAVAVANIEDAARTQDDFINVGYIWDEKDRIERWRVDKQEEQSADPKSTKEQYGIIIPQPLGHPFWRELLSGNFIDIIHDCPHELHEITTSAPIYDLMKVLDENRKEILYYWAIRLWSPQRIAAYRGQTDRNIRKVYNKMIDEMREKLYKRLYPRYKAKESLTYRQREFVEGYVAKEKQVETGGDEE